MLAFAAVLALCAAVAGAVIWVATRPRQTTEEASDQAILISTIDADGPSGGHDCSDCPTGDCDCGGGDCGGD